MNGDVGLTVLDARQQLRVIFAQAGAVRWISPLRLPDVDTVFAMTVHKSQGSEFTHAALILPQPPAHPRTRLHGDYPRQGGIHPAGRTGRHAGTGGEDGDEKAEWAGGEGQPVER